MVNTKESPDRLDRLAGRVLLVDDSPMTRLVTGKLLSSMGLRVTTAENGRDAVDVAWMACNKDYAFDLVLMDIDMPVMSGLDATRLLRHLGYDKPMIAVTGCADPDIEQQCMDAGFNHFLAKPFEIANLRAILKSCLKHETAIREICAA